MKTNEFIEKVSELGFTAIEKSDEIKIIKRWGSWNDYLASVYRDVLHTVRINNSPEMTNKLFDLITEYAKTPIADREDPEFFYVKHKHFPVDHQYLNLNTPTGHYFPHSKYNGSIFKSQLTQQQVDNIPWKLGEEWEVIPIDEED